MAEQILFVDDEAAILDGIRRSLRGRYEVVTAPSGAEALELIAKKGPFAVVVSDLKMPELGGIALLAKVREASPDTVRVMLTGQADLTTAVAAVNEGNIFRFLVKPCPTDVLCRVLDASLAMYRLVIGEREILERTLNGAVKVLTEILGLVHPEEASKSARIQRYVTAVAGELRIADIWRLQLAAMLSQLGVIALPSETLDKLKAGAEIDADERAMFEKHPEIGGRLLDAIPRLTEVAEMVAGQLRMPPPELAEKGVRDWPVEVLGAQLLRAATEFDRLTMRGLGQQAAVTAIQNPKFGIPREIGTAFRTIEVIGSSYVQKSLGTSELLLDMIIDEDVRSKRGLLLVKKGNEVTSSMLVRLRSLAQSVGIVEPFMVLVRKANPVGGAVEA